jgi:leucyl-tRNA synthetase
MVIAETLPRSRRRQPQWINPADVEVIATKGAHHRRGLKADGLPGQIGAVEKMSKSKNNGVDPQAMVGKYGADTVRLFSMFAAPPEMSLDWSENGVAGMARFLRRLWAYCHDVRSASDPKTREIIWNANDADDETRTCRRQVHEILSQANYDYERKQFNTVVSAAMKMLNALEGLGPSGVMVPATVGASSDKPRLANRQRAFVRMESLSVLFRLLAPITPHVAHSLWNELGCGGNILDAGWPKPDPAALKKASVTLAVQVNGKLRGTIEVAVDAPRDAIEQTAWRSDVAKYAVWRRRRRSSRARQDVNIVACMRRRIARWARGAEKSPLPINGAERAEGNSVALAGDSGQLARLSAQPAGIRRIICCTRLSDPSGTQHDFAVLQLSVLAASFRC